MALPDDVINAFYERRGVLFISAGCSISSGLPSAAELARTAIVAAHAGNAVSLEVFCQDTFGSPSPTLDEVAEYFLIRDGNLSSFAELIPFQHWSVPPNGVHKGVVRLAVEGFVDKVLTTNWDMLLETACHVMACSHIPLRSAGDLALPRNVDLSIYKIHGCKTMTTTLIAATSQLESGSAEYLWSDPQVVAAFQGSLVAFLGYSGSIPRISGSMARVAQWSQQTGIRHYAVDTKAWEEFRNAAPEFVAAAGLDEGRFLSSGAVEFVEELVHRLVRRLVLEIAIDEAPRQFREVAALTQEPDQLFASPDDFIDATANGEIADELMRTITRQFERYPSITAHKRILGRLFAWVAFLRNLGWSTAGGLPILQRGNEYLYLAAVEPGGAAIKASHHVTQLLRQNRDFRRTILGSGTQPVRCVLMGAQGDLPFSRASIALNAPASDIAYGEPPNIVFYTETQFIAEVQAA